MIIVFYGQGFKGGGQHAWPVEEKIRIKIFRIDLDIENMPEVVSDSQYLQMALEQVVQNAFVFRDKHKQPSLVFRIV